MPQGPSNALLTVISGGKMTLPNPLLIHPDAAFAFKDQCPKLFPFSKSENAENAVGRVVMLITYTPINFMYPFSFSIVNLSFLIS